MKYWNLFNIIKSYAVEIKSPYILRIHTLVKSNFYFVIFNYCDNHPVTSYIPAA